MPHDLTVVPGMENEPTFAEPTFDEPWQAQAFAMTVALHERGAFAWTEWAETFSAELERDPDYWPAWLRALEAIMTARDLAAPDQIDERTEAWREAADATPHGEPIKLR